MTKLTPKEKEIVNELAKSISQLLHMVVVRRLEQFFEVIKDEVDKANNNNKRQ